MNEWKLAGLEKNVTNGADFILYLYTPMCGSCQLATRMLSIAENTFLSDKKINKLNLNYAPKWAEKWQVTSVPALVKVTKGRAKGISYELGNVAAIFEFLCE